MAESQIMDMPGLGLRLLRGEGQARDRVVGIETTVNAAVQAHVGKIERSEHADYPAEALLGEAMRLLGQGVEERLGRR